jgi:hypothetical protein
MRKLCEFCNIVTGRSYKYLFIDKSIESLWFEFVGQYANNKSVLLCRTCHVSLFELAKVSEEVSSLHSKLSNAEQQREYLHNTLSSRVVRAPSTFVAIAPRPETPLKGGKRVLFLSPRQASKKADVKLTPVKNMQREASTNCFIICHLNF